MNKTTKKKIRKIRKTKLYDLDGGSIKSAEKYFNDNFKNIMTKLKNENYLEINKDKGTTNETFYNNESFSKLSNSYQDKLIILKSLNRKTQTNNYQEKSRSIKENDVKIKNIQKEIFSKIKDELISLTETFFDDFLKNSYSEIKTNEDKDKFLKNIETDEDFINKFTNIQNQINPDKSNFLDEYIEWILISYNQGKFKIYDTDLETKNLLFKNYIFFLNLYVKIIFLIKNSQILLEIKNREVFLKLIEILKLSITLPRDTLNDKIAEYKKTPNGKNIVDSILKQYYDIKEKYKKGETYYILGQTILSKDLKQEHSVPSIETQINISTEKLQKKVKASSSHHSENKYAPIHNNLFELNNFCDEYKEEINKIKNILINNELKKIGSGPNNAIIVKETDGVYVYKIITKAGSLYYGSNTKWCTATKSPSNMFDHYNKDGFIYIIQRKDENSKKNSNNRDMKRYTLQNSTDKFQLHIESSQLMDKNDKSVTLNFIIDFFKEDKELEKFLTDILSDSFVYNSDNTELTITSKINSIIDNEQKNIKFKEEFDKNKNKLKKLFLINFDIIPKSVNILINLTHLDLGDRLNYELHNELDELKKLTHLTFGNSFNSDLNESLDNLVNLTHLKFGNDFNQNTLYYFFNLKKLTELTFGKKYEDDFYFLINLKNLKQLNIENEKNIGEITKLLINPELKNKIIPKLAIPQLTIMYQGKPYNYIFNDNETSNESNNENINNPILPINRHRNRPRNNNIVFE